AHARRDAIPSPYAVCAPSNEGDPLRCSVRASRSRIASPASTPAEYSRARNQPKHRCCSQLSSSCGGAGAVWPLTARVRQHACTAQLRKEFAVPTTPSPSRRLRTLGETRYRRLTQSVRRAMRETRFVAALTEPITETGGRKRLTVSRDEEGQMTRWRSLDESSLDRGAEAHPCPPGYGVHFSPGGNECASPLSRQGCAPRQIAAVRVERHPRGARTCRAPEPLQALLSFQLRAAAQTAPPQLASRRDALWSHT